MFVQLDLLDKFSTLRELNWKRYFYLFSQNEKVNEREEKRERERDEEINFKFVESTPIRFDFSLKPTKKRSFEKKRNDRDLEMVSKFR